MEESLIENIFENDLERGLNLMEKSPSYDLLVLGMLYNFERAIKVLEGFNLNENFLKILQKSEFYLHRKAVPVLLRNNINYDYLLKNSLNDKIIVVVKEAVKTILLNNNYTELQLKEVLLILLNNKLESVRILSVQVALCIRDNELIIRDLLNLGWRIKIRLAYYLNKFSLNTQNIIIERLINDECDIVRLELAKNLYKTNYYCLLNDNNYEVRANYLNNIINNITDINILLKLSNDESWDVKLILIKLNDKLFEEIVVPILKTINLEWRINYKIMEHLEKRLENINIAKLVSNYLFNNVNSNNNIIREKACLLLIIIIEKYNFSVDFNFRIENILNSKKYLRRINLIKVVLSYDKKYNSNLSKYYENDKVEYVKLKYYKIINKL